AYAGSISIGSELPTPAAHSVATVDAFSELVTSFQTAKTAWKKQIKDTKDVQERSALRKQHPAKAFWPRFESMAQSGEGQALLWMVGNAKDQGTARKELPAVKQRLYGSLIKSHVSDSWFGDVVASIGNEKRGLDGEVRDVFLASILDADGATDDTRAQAGYTLGNLLASSKDEATIARGKQLLAMIAEDYAGTKWAIKAFASSITKADLEAGKMAPDFVGATIDGHEFKLSDYRGKVVLVDFYGFW
ncbi:MAG: hypothetical protein ACI8QC_004131, partial [Planctomycetota bacterium]